MTTMKIFRNSILAAAALVFGLTSCNSDGPHIDNEEKVFIIQVSGAPQNRAEQSSGQGVTATLSSGVAFLIAPDGSVVASHGLSIGGNPGDIDGPAGQGQVLGSYPSNTRVFIVGNVADVYDAATYTALTGATTWNAIQQITQTTASYANATAELPILSNHSGQPASMSMVTSTEASVTVSISPVTARLELGTITGGVWTDPSTATNQTEILGFTIAGVYVDNYFEEFNYAGVGQGDVFSQGVSTTFAGIGDPGSWIAAGTPGAMVAAPALATPTNWWAYNVPAGTISRIMIAVTNVTYQATTDGGTNWVPGGSISPTNTYYLTISDYRTGPGVAGIWNDNFVRGFVYGVNNITFNTVNLHNTPNPTEVPLTVNITVRPWDYQGLNADLQ
ncbi:MAG: hypothetical protein LBI15_00850 [Dysgonamonadaceae bacterium]|jgi:hypothetical protein|nr:hypothetical protein [Dysgonamonadaceae bacterium]